MPFVAGYLKRIRRPSRPGRPDIGLPDPEHPVDPDYGIDEGAGIGGGPIYPEVDPPEPPPGLWPPLTPEQPWRPIDPGWGQGRPERPGHPLPRPPGLPPRPGQGLPGQPPQPGQPLPGEPPTVGGGPVLPPGTVWPPLPPGVSGLYWALVAVGGMPGGTVYRYVIIDADARPEHPMPPTAQPK